MLVLNCSWLFSACYHRHEEEPKGATWVYQEVAGGTLADIIGDIHTWSWEALWLLPIDYEVSVKSSATPGSCSYPRPSPTRLPSPPFSVWFTAYCQPCLVQVCCWVTNALGVGKKICLSCHVPRYPVIFKSESIAPISVPDVFACSCRCISWTKMENFVTWELAHFLLEKNQKKWSFLALHKFLSQTECATLYFSFMLMNNICLVVVTLKNSDMWCSS